MRASPRLLSLAVKVLSILTIVTAVFTKNYALFVVALVCGIAVVLFEYLKHLPKPVSMLGTGTPTGAARHANHSSDFTASQQTAPPPSAHHAARDPHPAHFFDTNAMEHRMPATHAATAARNFLTMPQAAHARGHGMLPTSRRRGHGYDRRPTLADAVPAHETMESRVGRSALLRQNADYPVPRGAQAAMNRAILTLAPLPPGPNMQLVTPEELARERMQAAPLFQRI
jgi:hypothetical protein